MPLTYQNPWNFSDTGNSLGELLARVPQIRAQQAMMQQQMMLEQQKIANEQQYQQGMLGVHNQANQISLQTMQQNAPEVAARTQMLLGEAGKYSQEQARQQKLNDLATMFGKAYRTAAGYPSYDNYQGGPTIDNAKQLNLGDLAQSEATIEAMNPHQSLIGNTLRMQAQQQQGPFSIDQLNALITGGHLNNPHQQPMLHGKPGDVFVNPTNTNDQVVIPGEVYHPKNSLEESALAIQKAYLNQANQETTTRRVIENGMTNTVPNPTYVDLMNKAFSMTNMMNHGQAPKANMPSQKVMTATNPKTGQKIQSLDGGKTWSLAQ